MERERVKKRPLKRTKKWLGLVQVWHSLSQQTISPIASVNRLILLTNVASRAAAGGGGGGGGRRWSGSA